MGLLEMPGGIFHRLAVSDLALGKDAMQKPLAESLGSELILPCDVEDIASVDAVFAEIEQQWGALDFYVHAIGFSDKNELKGRYADTSRENFSRTMVISCFSFTEGAKRAARLMRNGGAMLTLTFNGSERTMPISSSSRIPGRT